MLKFPGPLERSQIGIIRLCKTMPVLCRFESFFGHVF